jgi:hypothetical protein
MSGRTARPDDAHGGGAAGHFACFGFAVVGLLLITGSPAHADWTYTKWGMTPEEVLAASAGKGEGVKVYTAEQIAQTLKDLTKNDTVPACVTEAEGAAGIDEADAHFVFNSKFVFTTGAHKLRAVRLDFSFGYGSDGKVLKPPALLPLFTKLYGQPVQNLLGVSLWKDEKTGDAVMSVLGPENGFVEYAASGGCEGGQ